MTNLRTTKNASRTSSTAGKSNNFWKALKPRDAILLSNITNKFAYIIIRKKTNAEIPTSLTPSYTTLTSSATAKKK